MSSDVKIIKDNPRVRPDKSEVDRLLCDNTKLMEKTSWKPKYNLESGLAQTIEWFKANKDIYKPEIYNI